MRKSRVQRATSPNPARRDERGAAVVEMALVILVLATFIFGIMVFGYLFSLRQNLTQAAAEGARAGAVAVLGQERTQADGAVASAVQTSFGKSCNAGTGLTCNTCVTTDMSSCPIPAGDRNACLSDATAPCVQVQLVLDRTKDALLANPPLVGIFLPSTFTVSSTARVSTT